MKSTWRKWTAATSTLASSVTTTATKTPRVFRPRNASSTAPRRCQGTAGVHQGRRLRPPREDAGPRAQSGEPGRPPPICEHPRTDVDGLFQSRGIPRPCRGHTHPAVRRISLPRRHDRRSLPEEAQGLPCPCPGRAKLRSWPPNAHRKGPGPSESARRRAAKPCGRPALRQAAAAFPHHLGGQVPSVPGHDRRQADPGLPDLQGHGIRAGGPGRVLSSCRRSRRRSAPAPRATGLP